MNFSIVYNCLQTCRILQLRKAFNVVKIRNVSKRPQISTVTDEQQMMLRSILTNYNKNTNNIDWKSVRKEIIGSQKYINEINVDAVVLATFNSEDLEAAKSYIDFLKSNTLQVNNAVIGRLMKLYYLTYKSGKLTEENKNEILQIYEDIRSKNEIMDPITCENLIYGIIATDKWKISLDLINMIKITCKPRVATYSVITAKCFESQNTELGWKLLQNMITDDRLPRCEIFIEYFRNAKLNSNTFKENLEKMFQFIREHRIVLSSLVVNELNTILKELKIKSAVTKIAKQGKCNNCGTNLEDVSITKKEFESLSTSFLDKVLIRKDVFQKSTPEEIEKFKKFVDSNQPFDCVIDGLNVAYFSGVNKSPTVYAKLLSSVTKYLIQENKRLLIVGRKHMLRWPKDQLNFIQRNAKIFFAENLTQDDPFLLYAALKSGPKTDFISCDLMRSHAYLLGPNLKNIFQRWQQEHQYMLISVKHNYDVILREPIKFNLNAHKVKNTWHIPFKDEYSAMPGNSLITPSSWLCISQ